MIVRVCMRNAISEQFSISGLKQDCVLARTRFSIYLTAMPSEVTRYFPSVDIRYRLDGRHFNLAHIKSKTRNIYRKSSIQDLQYSDDNATPIFSVAALQRCSFSKATIALGWEVNANKTNKRISGISCLVPGQDIPEITINIGDLALDVANVSNTLTIRNLRERHRPQHQIRLLCFRKTHQARI